MARESLLGQVPVLTGEELAALLPSEKGRTRESLIAYHVRRGHLLRVRRGLYAVVPPGVSPQGHSPDPYLLAAKMADDAILAYHTALEVHGKAHSVFERFFFLTSTRARPVTFRAFRFESVRHPRALRRRRQESFGVKTVDRSGVPVRVTTLERTLVDVLDRSDLGGGWEEIWRSLESVEFFDLDKVVEYALLLDNATTVAKVGYFLDQHREPLMVEDSHLARLKKRRPKRPHYMERRRRESGRLVAEWNLVVPVHVAEHSWEEGR